MGWHSAACTVILITTDKDTKEDFRMYSEHGSKDGIIMSNTEKCFEGNNDKVSSMAINCLKLKHSLYFLSHHVYKNILYSPGKGDTMIMKVVFPEQGLSIALKR